MFWYLLDTPFKVPNILAIWMVQTTTNMPENMKETAACDTLSWPLPVCVKAALHHHGTSDRLASTGRPTVRCPTHLTAHKARAGGHRLILGRGRGGVLVAGTTKVLSRDAGAIHGASGDLLVQEARSSRVARRRHPSITAVGLVVAGARCVAFNVLIGAPVKKPLCVLSG